MLADTTNALMNTDVSAEVNPYAPPRASVRDIADLSVRFELADRGERLGAIILDGLIFALMVYVPLFVTAGYFGLNLWAFAGFIVCLVINYRLLSRNGQSIGKKLLNIKVVRPDGSRASLARVFWVRSVLNGVLGVVPLYTIVDFLFIFGEARRCLHDRLADTIVIKA